MSYNDIADIFSQYSNEKNAKNCEHLKELFAQAMSMIDEESQIPQEILVKSRKKRPTPN